MVTVPSNPVEGTIGTQRTLLSSDVRGEVHLGVFSSWWPNLRGRPQRADPRSLSPLTPVDGTVGSRKILFCLRRRWSTQVCLNPCDLVFDHDSEQAVLPTLLEWGGSMTWRDVTLTPETTLMSRSWSKRPRIRTSPGEPEFSKEVLCRPSKRRSQILRRSRITPPCPHGPPKSVREFRDTSHT